MSADTPSTGATVNRVDTKLLALLLLCGAQFIVILDAVIVNVALPDMQRDLGLSQAGLQWVVNAYVLVYGGCLLLGGRAADVFGRRRMFVAGLILFSVASLVGGLAPTGTALIIARAVQGLGGALISPAALSLIAALFSDGPSRNRAMSAQGAVAASGAAFGVLLGGILTGLFGWQSVLLVNVPLGIALAILSRKYLPADVSDPVKRGFDLPGGITITVGLAALVYAVVGSTGPDSNLVPRLASLALSLVSLALFVLIERRTREPLLRSGIFKNRQLLGANLVALFHPIGPLTTLFFLSLFMQKTLLYPPLQAGLAFLPFAFAAAIGAIAVSQLAKSVSLSVLITLGFALMAIGTLLLAALPTDASYLVDILPGSILVGIGITTAGVPIFISAVSNIDVSEAGLAGGLVNTSQQIGSALALAALVAVASKVTLTGGELEGWRTAFLVAAGLLTAGAIATFLLFRNPPLTQKDLPHD